MKRWTMMICAFAGAFALAQPGGPRGDGLENEDLQWIFQWERDQRVTEIAGALALSAEQVEILTGVKAQVEAIQAEFEPQRAALELEAADAAAGIRANIEATGVFSDEDREVLGAIREEHRALTREMKLRFELATMPLENFLTDEQRAVLAELLRREGQDRRAQVKPGGEEGASDNARSGRDGRRDQRAKGRVVRMLLSDAFLGFYTNP